MQFLVDKTDILEVGRTNDLLSVSLVCLQLKIDIEVWYTRSTTSSLISLDRPSNCSFSFGIFVGVSAVGCGASRAVLSERVSVCVSS